MTLEYLPDARPATPGAIVSGYGIRPTGSGGYANFRTLRRYNNTSGWAALATAPNMLWANNFEDKGRIVAATNTKLYELGLSGGVFTTTDVSNGTYTAPSYPNGMAEQSDPAHWVFANYGQVVLAGNKWNSAMQAQSTRAANFANVSGSPALGCMTVWKNFVIGGNVGTYGAVTGNQDMVAWSALSDYTSWVPSSATQAGNQRLLDITGRIIAVQPIGDALAVLKADALWLAYYVGPPIIMAFQLVDGAAGINTDPGYPPPIVDIGKGLIWVSRDDIVFFDGVSTKSIARGRVRQTLRANFSDAHWALRGTHITHEPSVGEIYFWRYGVSYNYNHDRWGSLPFNEGIDIVAANYSPAFAVDYGSAGGIINAARQMVAKSDKLIYNRLRYSADGANLAWDDFTATLSEIGNNGQASTLRRAFVQFGPTNPTSTPALTYSRKIYLGGAAVADGSGTFDATKFAFDLMRDAYWHQVTIAVPGSGNTVDMIVLGVEYDVVSDGKRVEARLQPA